MSDYTPTTADVRRVYCTTTDMIGYETFGAAERAEFDRWLAKYTAEAAIQSAREVLDDYPLDFPESELPLRVLRRPLVGWLPVPDTTNNESEGKA